LTPRQLHVQAVRIALTGKRKAIMPQQGKCEVKSDNAKV
jgi:hypothetical protein